MQEAKKKQLRQILESAGISDPDFWVREADLYAEPTPMIEKALFLREAWHCILRKGDTDWLKESIEDLESRVGRTDLFALRFLPELPELREALKRVHQSGANVEDLTMIIRQSQIDVLAHVIQLLDGGLCFEDGLESSWAVCALDKDLEPATNFGDMNEMMWEFDPDRDDSCEGTDE